MKPQLTLVALFFLFLGSVSAQIRYKVKLLSDNVTYQVNFRPETNWSNPLSATTGGQVTMRVPVGGFSPGPITNLTGDWKLINTVTSPIEAPGYVYYIFALNAPMLGNQITYTNGVEIPMFKYKNNGACTGPVEIINNSNDPFLEPNSQSLSVRNYLNVLGAGQGVNAYIGNYTTFPADCTTGGGCGIEVFDVALVSPSACGVADGSITIDATNSNGLPMQYTINYGTPQVIWQSSPVFSNLAAGATFQVAVRDIIGLCIEEVGPFQLNGPLAAIVQGVDITQPDCGGTNGSITINAVSANGGTLQFAMNQNGPWQASHTFSNLAEGTYTFYVRDITNNCSNPVGTYTLTGCVVPDCILTYDLNHLGNGKYEVTMLTDTTWNTPLNQTSNLQVTIKVPTGGFEVGNVVEQIPNVDFAVSETVIAPIEDPAYDYVTISLTAGTDQIPYVQGNTVHLFTFENVGTCTGDSIRFMLDDDPFTQPNSQNSTAGQYISVLGYGAPGAPICLAKNAVACEETVPPPPGCLITYEIEKLPGDVIQVSIIADTLWTGPINNFTSAAQVTIKVPTGGFQVGSLTSLVGNWQVIPTDFAPTEEPTSDYITFILSSPGNLDVFQDGVKVPIFTFKNEGTCQNGSVTLMADNDPFFPPNSNNSNVGQYMSPAGSQGELLTICLLNQPVDDCSNDPCASLAPNFGPLQGCEGAAIAFKDSTITNNDAITSWSWDFGDNSAVSTSQNPSHTYSSSGNFEVSLTVTTQGGCSATYMDFVTVFPSPGDAPVSTYNSCSGIPVTIETPDNITSAVWTPTTGLDLTDPFNPIATPAATTVYTLTATNAYGCVNTSQVTINVVNKPVLTSVTPTPISDCNKSDASIQINATGVNNIEYGLDSGNGIVWQSSSIFANLMSGNYNVFVRNADGSCEVAYNGNPVIIAAPEAPVITNVASVQPNNCNNDGSITITATGGVAPLNYSIGGQPQTSGTFTGLGAGTYNIVVTNANGTCAVTAPAVVLVQPTPPTIVAPIADQKICVGASANIAVQLSKPIASYTITGTGVHSGEAINGNTLNFVASANAVGATTYNITLSEANGCSASTSFTLTGVAVPTSSFTVSPTICTNGDVVLNFTGTSLNTAKLTWSLAGGVIKNASVQNANMPDSATVVVNWATAGTKTITLEVDNGGCKANFTQTITVAAFDPNASFVLTHATCGLSNGAIDLTVNGTGFNYAWNNGITTQDLTNIPAGAYTVTITEPNSGCKATTSATINGSPSVNFSTTKTDATSCTGANGDGSIKITVNSGTSPYTYSVTGQTPVPSPLQTLTFSNLVAGAYTVIVTDAVGCSKSAVVTIGSTSSQLAADVQVTDAGCTSNNGSITATVSNGQSPYSYTLYKNNQPVGQPGIPVNGNSVQLNGLEPASYLFIFEDAVGCIVAVAATVERMEGFFPATAVITDASCGVNNGSIVLEDVPTNSIVAWSSGNGSNLPAGVYSVTITEAGGCSSSATYVVSTVDGAEVTINSITPASCGMANGSVVFTVTNSNPFNYSFLGASFPGSQGFGTNDVQTTVSGIPQGAYVLEITDAVTQSCKVYEVVVLPGSSAITMNTSTLYATGCGNHNGKITLNIFGGQAPFTLVSSVGTVSNGNSATQFIVNDLYEGDVVITATDAVGCVSSFTQNMGDFVEPNITLDSIAITKPLCPDSLGAIVSLSTSQYMVVNPANNSVVGFTPWTAAPAGTYMLIQTIGNCQDTLTNLVVEGPAAWNVVPTIIPQGCGNDLGSIALTVSGATGPYSYNWGGGTNSNLIAGAYPVTITDANGCVYEHEYSIPFDCPNPCLAADTLFYLDTVYVDLTAPLTEFCLPTHETNLEDYDLTLDGVAYNRQIGDCGDATTFYNGFDVLPTPGPYTLVEWTFGNEKQPNIPFMDFEDLVIKMNNWDPFGNWVLNQGTIFGGVSGKVYGLMKIRHNASGNAVDLQPSKLTVPSPTILLDNHSLTQTLVAMNVWGCLDTLVINVQLPAPATPSTIPVTVEVGETLQVCIPVDELIGNPEFLSNVGISFTGNAQVLATGDTCVEVVGLEVGVDQATIVICDDFGMCDTTYLLINVIDNSDDILIYTGFSPNGDGVNDFFKIKNIEKYPNNELQIFNRWGKRVYSAKGYKNGWNADYRGIRLTDGTYFYLLTVEINGETKEYKGFVEVRR